MEFAVSRFVAQAEAYATCYTGRTVNALPGLAISVVIPVFNAADTLQRCLHALAESMNVLECIVVDDGSTDASASLAQAAGATVLSTGGRFGPARARNIGAHRALGELILFVDADVAVHPDALPRIVERFRSDPDLDALIGSYDDSPSGRGFVSQFKNLSHSFVHHEGNRRAFSFWCGCGAIKRSVYLEYGGLDELYVSPSIEDIEFGLRLMRAGRKMALDSRIECQHLKIWTLWSMVRTDVIERGIPWTELILSSRYFADDLNLRWSQRFSVFLAVLLLIFGGAEAVHPSAAKLAGFLAALIAIGVLNRKFYVFLFLRRGWLFGCGAFWLHILYFLYCGLSFAMGTASFSVRWLLPSTVADGCAPVAAPDEE